MFLKKQQTYKWFLRIFLGVIIVLILSVMYAVASIYGLLGNHEKYKVAESELRAELSNLALPPEFELQSTTFRDGQCLDNCPALKSVYHVSATREEIGQLLKKLLEANGYEIRYRAGNVFGEKGENGKISIDSLLEPELGTGTKDYENSISQQTQYVTTLTVWFNYKP